MEEYLAKMQNGLEYLTKGRGCEESKLERIWENYVRFLDFCALEKTSMKQG